MRPYTRIHKDCQHGAGITFHTVAIGVVWASIFAAVLYGAICGGAWLAGI
jgi:hypothetical protein